MSMKLSDLGLPTQDTDYDSITLSKLNGRTIDVISTEFKKLGNYDGVVMKLKTPIDAEGKKWEEVHSSIDRIVEKTKHEKFQDALKKGSVSFTVVSGRNKNGTWYDIE